MLEPERYVRGWFKGADTEDIGIQDVKKWLAWAFFDRDWADGQDEDEIEDYALQIQGMLRKDFGPGSGNAKPLRLTIDPVNMLHRSLLWYLVRHLVSCFPSARAFKYSLFTALASAYTLTSTSFLRSIPLMMEIPSMIIAKLDEMCTEIGQIIAKHNYDRFALVSHSYGSVIGAFILGDQFLRPKVASTLLVDPMSFLLHTPDVTYNFTTRQPRRANEWQLWYFASRDPGVAHALGRRFFWSQKVMWHNDVRDFINEGMHITVSLGGKDLIVNTEAVGRYLTESRATKAGQAGVRNRQGDESCTSAHLKEDAWKHMEWKGKGLEVLWFEHLDHGQVFDRKTTMARLAEVVQNYCENDAVSIAEVQDTTSMDAAFADLQSSNGLSISAAAKNMVSADLHLAGASISKPPRQPSITTPRDCSTTHRKSFEVYQNCHQRRTGNTW
ncbi:hypothetical protein KC353_g20 [Hortaea werneckii]|nr:hypothetical protein KC353_g20 [Hortaea werneckii]